MIMQVQNIKNMNGILKNSFKGVIVLSFFILFSCNNDKNLEQDFIENNFIEIVDTLAYGTGSFINLPKDTIKYSKLAVKFHPKIDYSAEVESIVNQYFKENRKTTLNYDDLLKKGTYSNFLLNDSFQKQIGKYIIFTNDKEIDKNIKYAGRVDFQNMKIYKDKAFLVFYKSLEKQSVAYILLFKKENDNWKLTLKDVLFQT